MEVQQGDSKDIKEEDNSDDGEAEDFNHRYKESNKNNKVEQLGKWANHRGNAEEMNKNMHTDIEADDRNTDEDEAVDEEEEQDHDDDNNEEEDNDDDNEVKQDDDEEDDKAAKYIPEDLRVKQQLSPVEDDGEEEEHNEEDLDGNELAHVRVSAH
ncbi:glutamic acid-rich protein-like [Dreissena polymorpha]|uniref:glutamic acid-rich protein-like n=1 Tax=Dreissena polymorpha TaxID=45954 RepID=UPI00226474DB|nr:glutamic acid-rich protein-like [Dreissena polymorpha]